MKSSYVMVRNEDFVGTLDELLKALEPGDVPKLEAAVARLNGFRALLARLFPSDAVPPPGTDPGELLERVADEVASLSALVKEELGRGAVVAALCRNEVADTDKALAESQGRCDRYRAERDALRAELDGKCAVCCTACRDMLGADTCVACERDGLREWRDAVSGAVKGVPEFHAGAWAGDKEGWGYHVEVIGWLTRKRDGLAAELEEQKALAAGLAERVAAQSELLSKRAEAPAAGEKVIKGWAITERTEVAAPEIPGVIEVPTAPYPSVPAVAEPERRTCSRCPADIWEPESLATGLCAGCRAPAPTQRVEAPSPPATGVRLPPGPPTGSAEGARLKKLQIARALASGPLRVREVVERTGLATSTAHQILSHIEADRWFVKADVSDRQSPYQLTGAGRQALADDGFIVAPAAEAKGVEPEAPKAEPEPPSEQPAERIDPADKAAVERAQLRLIAEAVAGAGEPLSAHEISTHAGLPVDVVRKRLEARGKLTLPVGERLFTQLPTGLWKLTNAGYDLAREAVQA